MSADDYSSGWDREGDELVRRLSRIEWAPVPSERMAAVQTGRRHVAPRRALSLS